MFVTACGSSTKSNGIEHLGVQNIQGISVSSVSSEQFRTTNTPITGNEAVKILSDFRLKRGVTATPFNLTKISGSIYRVKLDQLDYAVTEQDRKKGDFLSTHIPTESLRSVISNKTGCSPVGKLIVVASDGYIRGHIIPISCTNELKSSFPRTSLPKASINNQFISTSPKECTSAVLHGGTQYCI